MAVSVGPVVYAIYIDGILIRDFALDVELRQSWGNHDLFIVRFEFPRTDVNVSTARLWKDNATVRIIWGRKPDLQTWYGYVNHHEIKGRADSGTGALQISYVCIGTSKPMNTDKTRTWGEVTATYIARKIADEYGLRAVLSKTDWVFPYEIQSNESDFHFLNRMANKIGFRNWISGGSLYFIDPSVILVGSRNQAVPKFRMDKRFTYMDTIRDFHMFQGGSLPGATVANRAIYGVDENSGKIFYVQADPLQSSPNSPDANIDYIMDTWPATSMNTAKRLVNAWQQRAQFWQSASADLFGNTYIYPGKTIYLEGTQMPPDSSGYWLVASACHTMRASGTSLTTSDRYYTHVEILKNSTSIDLNFKQVTKVIPEFVPCLLRNGKWVAQSAPVLYDGVSLV
jgi:hypothetical protein